MNDISSIRQYGINKVNQSKLTLFGSSEYYVMEGLTDAASVVVVIIQFFYKGYKYIIFKVIVMHF